MKSLCMLAGFVVLGACTVPVVTIDGAIPFSQVMAETADLPYECSAYDARTDSCRGYSTHEPQGDGRFLATSTVRLAEEVPAIEATYSVVETGNVVCSINSTLELRFAREVGLSEELRLAEFESAFKAQEDTCFIYTRTENGYRSQVVRGPEEALADPISDYQFFNAPKRLRVRG